jgi:hypothetical protein
MANAGSYMGVSATWTVSRIASHDQPTRCSGRITAGHKPLAFSAFVRWCGHVAWSKSDVRSLMDSIGVPLTDTCIDAQWEDGDRVRRQGKAHHGKVPQLPQRDVEVFEAARQSLTVPSDKRARESKPDLPSPQTPIAVDITEPPARQEQIVYRILRDTALARRVKALHKNECQICGHTIVLSNGSRYSEAHHIHPLGTPHNGLDVMGNIICVCPNHHAELDYGARLLSRGELRAASGHSINDDYIRHHNQVICGKKLSG